MDTGIQHKIPNPVRETDTFSSLMNGRMRREKSVTWIMTTRRTKRTKRMILKRQLGNVVLPHKKRSHTMRRQIQEIRFVKLCCPLYQVSCTSHLFDILSGWRVPRDSLSSPHKKEINLISPLADILCDMFGSLIMTMVSQVCPN